MLDAHERDAAAIDHQLAGVRGAHTNHEHDIDVAVDLEQRSALLLRLARERDDVGAVEHGAQVVTIGTHRVSHDLLEVRAGGFDDVVVPVRLEQGPVRREVPVVGSRRVRALQYREEIG